MANEGLACDPPTENIMVAGGDYYWMVVSNIHYVYLNLTKSLLKFD